MRTIIAAVAVLALVPAAAHARTLECGGDTGHGWQRNPDPGAGIWRVQAVNVGCVTARRIAKKSFPLVPGQQPVTRWRYRGWRCRDLDDGYEHYKAGCFRGRSSVVWEGGS